VRIEKESIKSFLEIDLLKLKRIIDIEYAEEVKS
jgi:hypothetical protein